MVLHRRHTYFGFKSAAKDGQLEISAIQSNLFDRLGGIAEHASSRIDSRVHNIGMRRITGCLFEHPNEATLTETNHNGKLMIGNICPSPFECHGRSCQCHPAPPAHQRTRSECPSHISQALFRINRCRTEICCKWSLADAMPFHPAPASLTGCIPTSSRCNAFSSCSRAKIGPRLAIIC